MYTNRTYANQMSVPAPTQQPALPEPRISAKGFKPLIHSPSITASQAKATTPILFALRTIFPRWLVALLPLTLAKRRAEITTELREICLQLVRDKKASMEQQNTSSPLDSTPSTQQPKDILSRAGIPQLIDLPEVGKNLQDQIIVFFHWRANQPTTSTFLRDPANVAAAMSIQ